MLKGFAFAACGGDEGSRTPVRKYCHTTFSERRRHILFRFPNAYRRASELLSQFVSLKAPGKVFKVSCLLTVHPHRQEKLREQLAVRLLKRILVQRLYLNGPPIIVQMEPRLAYHTAPTPVETSTSPNQRLYYWKTPTYIFFE